MCGVCVCVRLFVCVCVCIFFCLSYYYYFFKIHKQKLIVRVLRTVSLIATRLERPSDFDIMFQKGHLDSVLRIVESGEAFVQLQALHLISELGIGQEKELKQRVLEGGAVPAIVEVKEKKIVAVILSCLLNMPPDAVILSVILHCVFSPPYPYLYHNI